jgi:hypothetical protein
MPVVQFAPFASLVQPAFWHELTRLKIDVLRLSQDSLPLTGAYSVGRAVRDREVGPDVALGCNLSLGADAFDDAPTYVYIATDRSNSPSIQRPRSLRLGPWHYNTIQDFKAAGKAALFNTVADEVRVSHHLAAQLTCAIDVDQHRRAQGLQLRYHLPTRIRSSNPRAAHIDLQRTPCRHEAVFHRQADR